MIKVDGKWSGRVTVAPRSDGEGEFGEGRGEPMVRVEVKGEFVVAAAEVLDEGVPRTDHSRRAQPFKTAHRPQPGLEPSVISLDQIIRILLDDVAGGRQHLVEHSRVGWCLVGARVAAG